MTTRQGEPEIVALASNRRGRPTATEIARLLSPHSIAIIGASADPGKFAGRFAPSLQRQGYRGAIYPINGRSSVVAGLASYPDLAAVPGPVDCVIYAIAADACEAHLAACEAKGVRLVVITSAGFVERGDAEGARLQSIVSAFAQRTGIRVIGPNCVGFVNCVDRVAAAAATRSTQLTKPTQLGPITRMPVRCANAETIDCSRAPSASPRSTKPALVITTSRTPFASHAAKWASQASAAIA